MYIYSTYHMCMQCSVYHLVIHVYVYSVSSALHTYTVYHLVQYIHVSNYLCSCTVHNITKTFGHWKLLYTNYILQYTIIYTCIIIKFKGYFNLYSNHMTSKDHINQCCFFVQLGNVYKQYFISIDLDLYPLVYTVHAIIKNGSKYKTMYAV